MKYCTFEDFKELVLEYCKETFPKDFANGLEKYLGTDEAQKEMRNAYKNDTKKYENGEMTKEQFFKGSVAAVSYCLDLMF